MSYIVVYLRADGSSGVEECADLDLAVVAAERLRNVDSVERPRIFKTEEITYDFKPYYRVEVTTADESGDDWVGHSAAAAPADAPPVAPISTGAEEQAVVEEPTVAQTEVVEPVVEAAEAPADGPLEEQPHASPAMPDSSDVESGAADAAPKKGLFGDTSTAPVVDTPDGTPLVEDVKDSVPPRRGLFGR